MTTRTVDVPSTIDATGTSDAAAALNSWLGSVPNGSVIRFAPGGTYRMNTGLLVAGRSNLVLDGQGATFRLAGSGTLRDNSGFYLNQNNSDIAIRNFRIVGNSPTPGVYSTAGEYQHGVAIRGGTRLELTDIDVSAVWGDGLYVATNATKVWFHDARVTSNGRMGVAITNATDVLVERVAFDTVGYGLFDCEPSAATNVIRNVTFRNNTARRISLQGRNGFFFGANGEAGSAISNVTVHGNTLAEDLLYTYVTIDPQRRQNITVTDNTSGVAGAGSIFNFAHVDGVTVTGNTQRLTSGELVSVSDSTNVVISGNTTR